MQFFVRIALHGLSQPARTQVASFVQTGRGRPRWVEGETTCADYYTGQRSLKPQPGERPISQAAEGAGLTLQAVAKPLSRFRTIQAVPGLASPWLSYPNLHPPGMSHPPRLTLPVRRCCVDALTI